MTKMMAKETTMSQYQRDAGKSSIQLFRALAAAEIWVFLRQPVMIALTLLLPAGLLAITALAEASFSPQAWAQIAGRDLVAVQSILLH